MRKFLTLGSKTMQLILEFEEAAGELKEWGIPLIKVDGTREKELTDLVIS